MRADLICWQPVLTDHQVFTYQELLALSKSSVCAISVSKIIAERKEQGWKSATETDVRMQTMPRHGRIGFINRSVKSYPDSIHVFTSPFGSRFTLYALIRALFRKYRVYIISEPYSPISENYFSEAKLLGKIKHKVRPAIYKMYGWLISKRVTGVFAISQLAIEQYKSIGLPTEKIYPFGYFTPKQNDVTSIYTIFKEPHALKLCFVGSLIPRKGLSHLIHIVHELVAQGAKIELHVFGPGNPRRFDFDNQNVQYHGTLPFGKAHQTISQYDALVVPSLHDGWGVVVNEALSVGTPVIASNKVGAATLVEKSGAGFVYPGDQQTGLLDMLRTAEASRDELKRMRFRALAFAKYLEPQVAARYMWSIMNGDRDAECPWYSEKNKSTQS